MNGPRHSDEVDGPAEAWIRAHVEPVAAIETVHERPWAMVSRVPLVHGVAWFKECAPVQGFEAQLTASLFSRWPDRVTSVLAHDDERRWLLLADAGRPLRELGNPPEMWMSALPRYAELQRGEVAHVEEHLKAGVPDLRVSASAALYEDLLRHELPLGTEEIARLHAFAPRFEELSRALEACGVPPSVQHDDLHMNNVYERDGTLRIIDWGDSSIAHPFASLVVTFRFLEEMNGLRPGDRWFGRLRDAYLEPWGPGQRDTFDLAMRIGPFSRAFAVVRVRDQLPPTALPGFDEDFSVVLRRALAGTNTP